MNVTNLFRAVVAGGLSLLEPDPAQVPPVSGRIAAPEVAESSGLARSRTRPGLWWTHNDSGHPNRIYPMSASGDSLGNPVKVEGAVNVDWEDIAADGQGRLWIADLGNNANRRRDLKVYIIDEPQAAWDGESLSFPESVAVKRTLRVRYPDQAAFPPERMNFDCEGIFVRGGILYVLTKHRSDAHTRLYRLVDNGGEEEQVLEYLQSFENIGMVTGAALHPDGKHLAVLTYTGLWVFGTDGESEQFLGGAVRYLPAAFRAWGQVEGIDWTEDGALLISNEQRDLFRISMDQIPVGEP